jgi:hypothetical protein
MEQTTRNQLQRATQDARRLLESEFAAQLEGTFDILPDGTILPHPGAHLNDQQQLVRHKIVEAIEHIRLKNFGKTTAQAVDDYLREAAFTFLNRFAALKMMEARGLVQQCVTKGEQSSGFKEFTGLAPGLSSLPDKGYQLYLECLFDELGTEIYVLFDRRDSASLLWPRRQALLDLLDILNREALQGIWSEDETIGWVYQYFNSQEERKKMRDESAAPRNSRELAVRNQFFTPRYVVEFLTDNTLGRIWYEMTQGQTALKERCQYLVRGPNEVFLSEADSEEVKAAQQWLQSGEGERPELWPLAHTVNGYIRAGEAGEESNRWVEERLPRLNADSIAEFTTQELLDLLFLFCRKERFCEGTLDSLSTEIDLIRIAIDERIAKAKCSDLAQEELLKQPVFIPHRQVKDPRDIKLLDPACGSMHFGLYAFDLFEVIYDEYFSSRMPTSSRHEEVATAATPVPTDFPRLIIECNIHGIDIDPRAVQIAGLSLWLRAQKSWQTQDIKPDARPPIQRSNIVCAEPMPGEANMLVQFATALQPKVLGQLVKIIFEKMKLAGEAGSLLKIEDEIADAIQVAHQDYKKFILEQQQAKGYLPGMAPKREATLFDFADLPNAEDFWNRAEDLLVAALKAFAEEAENGGGFQRRLFAEDAARGFAFIDVCRKRYDVALMNPPFGEASKVSKPYIEKEYEHSASDILHAFVERGLGWLNLNGREGVISARTGFFLGNSKDWRKNVVFQNRLACFADLGLGVLDDALVEVAAYAIERGKPCGGRVYTNRQLDTREKEQGLLRAIRATVNSTVGGLGLFDQALLDVIPDHNFAYWSPAQLLKRYAEAGQFGEAVGRVRQGVATADDFRFARLGWEVASDSISFGRRWQRFSKGGEYSPPYDDIHLLVDWAVEGAQLKAFAGCFIRNESFYFQPGATYTVRTASAFAGKVLPAGCVFSHNAQSWFGESNDWTLLSVGYLSCRVPQTFLELAVGSGDIATAGSAARRYTTAVVESVPAGLLAALNTSTNLDAVRSLYRFRLSELMSDESSCHFSKFRLASGQPSLRAAAEATGRAFVSAAVRALEQSSRFDENVTKAFALSADEAEFVNQEVGLHPSSYAGSATAVEVARLFHLAEGELMTEAVSQHGSKRWFTKKSYFVDRRLEIICHLLSISPSTFESLLSEQPITVSLDEFARSITSEALGVAFGRWDVRYATGEQAAPELPDPFAWLPICPPGQLQNAEGLPARPEDVSAAYPVRIPWDGILVDDPNHPLDIECRVREVVEIIWKDKAEAIEHEACEILGVRSLRDYFRKPAGFFADHLNRYSKSRRQAPIYWPLSSSNGGYAIWCNYHRFRRDTLSLALGDFAKPKLRHEQKQLDDLSAEAGPQPTRSQREQIEAQESLVSELSAFVEELARAAPLWNPDLNDGVIINYAPLWRMIGHTPWRKSVKECWDMLCAGDYDWAHLAMHLWPERCVPKCADDRSLAIAHDLDNLLWVEDYGKWRKILKPVDEILDQKQRRQRPVYDRLRDALQQLVDAPHVPTSAEILWQRLESGQLDETSLALMLWPRRVVERCINDRALAKTLGVPIPARLTEKSTEQLIIRYECSGLPQSVPVVCAVFQRATLWANVWHELEQGAYDQQTVALWLWPDRVIEKCLADRELCAQHELTSFFWYDDPVTGWRRRVAPAQEVTAEVTRRHNPTVKAALDSLLTAPPLTGAGGGRRGSRTTTTQRATRATASEAAHDDAPPRRGRPRTLAPTTDIETLDMVKNVIADIPTGASKSDVLTATGLSEARWTAAINTLLQQGSVTKSGERRGSRYHVIQGVSVKDSSTADESEGQE